MKPVKVQLRAEGRTWATELGPGDFRGVDPGGSFTGLQKVLHAVAPMPQLEYTEPHPWLELWVYDHGGPWWAELRVANDAIDAPIGFLPNAHLTVFQRGVGLVVDRRGGQVEDQTGWVLRVGSPRWAVRTDLLDYMHAFPRRLEIPPDRLAAWKRCWPDPDPAWNTHQTGSPRNAPWPLALSKWLYGDGDPALLLPEHDFLLAQHGFWSEVGDRWIPGRPCHLTRYAPDSAEPYDYLVDYHVDRAAPVRLGEGVVQTPRWQELDALGREGLRPGIHDDPATWPFSRIHPWKNGHDHEHYELARVATLYLLTGSQLARREVQAVANTLLTREHEWLGTYTMGAYHSSRTLWWVTAGLLWAWLALREERYLAIARRVLDLWRSNAYGELLGRPNAPLPATRDFVLTRENQKAHWWWDSTDPVEATWQASVAVAACALGRLVDPDTTWRAIWDETATRVAELCRTTWTGTGHRENYGIKSDPVELTGEESTVGTRAWILGVVGDALRRTGDHDRFGFGLEHFNLVKDQRIGGHHHWRPGGDALHEWCLTGFAHEYGVEEP